MSEGVKSLRERFESAGRPPLPEALGQGQAAAPLPAASSTSTSTATAAASKRLSVKPALPSKPHLKPLEVAVVPAAEPHGPSTTQRTDKPILPRKPRRASSTSDPFCSPVASPALEQHAAPMDMPAPAPRLRESRLFDSLTVPCTDSPQRVASLSKPPPPPSPRFKSPRPMLVEPRPPPTFSGVDLFGDDASATSLHSLSVSDEDQDEPRLSRSTGARNAPPPPMARSKTPIRSRPSSRSRSRAPMLPPNRPTTSSSPIPSRSSSPVHSHQEDILPPARPLLPTRPAAMLPPVLPSRDQIAASRPHLPDRNAIVRQSLQIERPRPRDVRASLDVPRTRVPSHGGLDADSEEDESSPAENARSLDQPDNSTANRKPPHFKGKAWEIATGKEVRRTAVAGDWLVVAHSERLKVFHLLTQEVLWQIPVPDTRVTAMDFRTVGARNLADTGRFLWVGFKDGSLHEYDLKHRVCIERIHRAHTSAIVSILRDGHTMWTLDEGGNLHIWPPAVSLKNRPSCTSIRTVPGIQAALAVEGRLWIGSGRAVHVFQATGQALTPERGVEPSRVTGLITSAIHLRHDPDKVYFSHDDGKISVYSTDRPRCIDVLSISHYNISALLSVGDYLWTAFKTGKVFVYDVHSKPWRVMKEWPAHKSPITELCIDRGGLWKEKRLGVCSVSAEGVVKVWDGLLMSDWLDAEMQKRIDAFSSFRQVRALVCTWNAGASVPSRLSRDYEDSQFIENMIRDAEAPDMIVFGFQELVDLDDKGKASRSVAKGFFGSKKKEEKLEEKALTFAYQQWQNHLEKQVAIASSETYHLVQVKQLVGLFTCVFVKEALLKHITCVDATVVKTGLKGRYGNKGGIIVRMTFDDTSICFVNCHLAAGQKHIMARNNDVFSILDQAALPAGTQQQLERHVFSGGGDGSMVLDHEVCILNGDLNYRINGRRAQVIQQVKEGKLGKLLEADQLLIELKRNPTHRLRSFQESTIRFPPTYKYDPGTDQYDSSEKARVPAWCDRVYYRGLGGSHMTCQAYQQHTCRVSDHRPVSALLSFHVKTVDDRRQEVYEQVARAWVDLANKTILATKLMTLKLATGCTDDKLAKEALKWHHYVVEEAVQALL